MADFTANFTLSEIESIDATFKIDYYPMKTSQLINDNDFVSDADYVHTDNNFTDDLLANLNNQSGVNTGDQDLSGLVPNTRTVNGHALSSDVVVTATDVNAPTLSSGTTAPTSTPAKIGDIYIDTTNIKTYVAKGASSSADWVKQNGCYSLQGYCNSSTLTASSTKYFGALFTRTFDTTDSSCRIIVPKSGTITNVTYSSFTVTLGSSEAVSLYIRVNNTTSYLVSDSLTFNSADKKYVIDGLSIPISKGNYISFELVAPAFSTTPAGIYSNAVALVEE